MNIQSRNRKNNSRFGFFSKILQKQFLNTPTWWTEMTSFSYKGDLEPLFEQKRIKKNRKLILFILLFFSLF